jgi:hypothetical protein
MGSVNILKTNIPKKNLRELFPLSKFVESTSDRNFVITAFCNLIKGDNHFAKLAVAL